MSRFTNKEIEYLQSQRLGRLATVNSKGEPHVVPVAFRYNPVEDTIDVGGLNIVNTKKYRDAQRDGRAAFVVDDVLRPGRPRMIEIRGAVQAVSEGGKAINPNFMPEILRLAPTYIISMGINDDAVLPPDGNVHFDGRKVAGND